jgi:TetR/AcrR family transcriptional repressor of nem operon
MNTETDAPIRLTAKGLATRDRIVSIAADLIHENGVHGTTNEDVRQAAGISGSQLSHYFRDKESLVRAVVTRRAEQVLVVGRAEPKGPLDSIPALRHWADFFIEREDVSLTGCRFGSLAGEVLKSDIDLKDVVSAGFARWETDLRAGLSAMRDRGELRPDADPNRLAYALLAAYQGGMLLTQAAQSIMPLEAALGSAIDYIATFVADNTKADTW